MNKSKTIRKIIELFNKAKTLCEYGIELLYNKREIYMKIIPYERSEDGSITNISFNINNNQVLKIDNKGTITYNDNEDIVFFELFESFLNKKYEEYKEHRLKRMVNIAQQLFNETFSEEVMLEKLGKSDYEFFIQGYKSCYLVLEDGDGKQTKLYET